LTVTKYNMCEAYVDAILDCNVAMNLAAATDSLGALGCIVGIIADGGQIGVIVAVCVFVAGCTTGGLSTDCCWHDCLIKKAIDGVGTFRIFEYWATSSTNYFT